MKINDEKNMPPDTLSDFVCLDSQRAIDDFLEATQWLHDSCIQSFFVSNPMYVSSTGNMVFPKKNFPGESNLTALFQSQFLEGCAIEFKLVGIDYLKCLGVRKNNDGIVLGAKISLGASDEITLICNPDEDGFFEVKARTAFWRLRRDLVDSLSFSIQPSLPT
jgi:hypothetical protein